MGDKLLRHGGIIFTASIISYFFAYLFHFYVARALGPGDYGVLGSILSLLYIFSVPSIVITTTLAQIVSEEKSVGEYGRIKSILLLSVKKLAFIGSIIFIIIILLSSFLKVVLDLPTTIPILTLGFSLIFITILPSPRGVLQGIQNFTSLGFNMAIEKPALLLFALLFIHIGMGVNGAILSYGTAAIVILILAFLPLKSILREESERVNVSIYPYAAPIFILILCITIMSSIDILFVRKDFPPEVSGYFTAMKMLGQVIYFSSIALGGVLLPKVSELNISNKKHDFLLRKTLIYFGIILATVISTYTLAPQLIITTLFGENYAPISRYLVWYAITTGLLSTAIIFMFYDVSLKRTAFRYPLTLLTPIQALLLIIFHETLDQVIIVQAATFTTLLIAVMIINRRYNGYLRKDQQVLCE